MRDNHTMIEDLLKLGENALGNILGARHDVGAQAKSGLGRVARKLDLVSREEFDAAFAMIAKARAAQEDMNERLTRIEEKLNIAPPVKKKNAAKPNLRSVKHNKQKTVRR